MIDSGSYGISNRLDFPVGPDHLKLNGVLGRIVGGEFCKNGDRH